MLREANSAIRSLGGPLTAGPDSQPRLAGGEGRSRWTLAIDGSLVVVAAVCVWLILSRLSLTDPRPLHNAGSYLLAAIAGLTALRWLGWRLLGYPLERALQLAFLGSLLVHLQLLNLAVNVLVLRFDLAGSSQNGGQPVIAKPRIIAQPEYFAPRGSSEAASEASPLRRELTAPAEAAYRAEQEPSLWQVPPQRQPVASANLFDTEAALGPDRSLGERPRRWERAERLDATAPRSLTNFSAASGPLPELSQSPLPLVEQRPGGRDEPAGLADVARDRPSSSPPAAVAAESIAWLANPASVPLPEQSVGLDPLPDPDQWQREQLQALSPTPDAPGGEATEGREVESANRPSERRLARSPRSLSAASGLEASAAQPRWRSASRIASSQLEPVSPSIDLPTVAEPERSADGPLTQALAASSVSEQTLRWAERQPELAVPIPTQPQPAFAQRLRRLSEASRRIGEPSAGEEPRPTDPLEQAIEAGLEFLTRQQLADGRWSCDQPDGPVTLGTDTAATSLALLVFLGAGHTPSHGPYAAVIERGFQALIDDQRSDGDLYRRVNPAVDQNAWLYSHSLAALALCEVYGMTRSEAYRGPAQQGIDFLVASQDQVSGGWRYLPGRGSDLSVTGWCLMALRTGELAGLKVPSSTYDGVRYWLRASSGGPDAEHLFRYNHLAPDTDQKRHGREPTAAMTAVGLLASLQLGTPPAAESIRLGGDYLLRRTPRIGTLSQPQRDTYYWYYATQVMFLLGGDYWDGWRKQLEPLLIDTQIEQGPLAGSWDPLQPVPDRWARVAGRLYVTCLNLLSLEVRYRQLPLIGSGNSMAAAAEAAGR